MPLRKGKSSVEFQSSESEFSENDTQVATASIEHDISQIIERSRKSLPDMVSCPKKNVQRALLFDACLTAGTWRQVSNRALKSLEFGRMVIMLLSVQTSPPHWGPVRLEYSPVSISITEAASFS